MKSDGSRQLSVVIASDQSIEDLDMCLRSLLKQAQGWKVELIVSCVRRDYSIESVVEKYPDIQFISFSERVSNPVLWGAGIQKAKGEIIAITDTTCSFDDDWIEAILKAHQAPHPVIGGVVEVRGCRSWVDWTAYFCEYGQFMRPIPEGSVQELPGNNISFKRWALDTGKKYTENGFWKTYWCRELQKNKIELFATPSMVIYMKKNYRLIPFLIRRFHHGRCFAGMRIAKASILSRSALAAGSIVLPFLFMGRLARKIIPKGRHRKEFYMTLPFSVLAMVSWSVGELLGYLVGPGKSCAHIY